MYQPPHEQVLTLLRGQLTSIATAMPIVRGLVVTVIWDPQESDEVPPGLAIFAPNQALNDDILFKALQQHAKIGTMLSGRLQQYLTAAIKQRQEKSGELEDKLRSTQTQTEHTSKSAGPVNPGHSNPSPPAHPGGPT
jgi:hypothetical protein